jgi:hypothetical protein
VCAEPTEAPVRLGEVSRRMMRRSTTDRPALVRAAIAAALAAGLSGLLGSGPAYGFRHIKPVVVTAPPVPSPTSFGSDLDGNPEDLLEELFGDVEYFEGGAGIQAQRLIAPVDGWLTGVAVKGNAVVNDALLIVDEPFRVGVEVILPNGQLEVVSTSDPPFRLPTRAGTYYFNVGPPHTNFAMRLKKGEVLSFDTTGGKWGVFARKAGAIVETAVGMGKEQDAHAKWTATPHPNIQLLMRVTEQPIVPTTDLDKAAASVAEAQTLEQQALGAKGRTGRVKLKAAEEELQVALRSVDDAATGFLPGQAGPAVPELSESTARGLKFALLFTLLEDGSARAKGVSKAHRAEHIKAAIAAKQAVLSVLRKATSMAKQVP